VTPYPSFDSIRGGEVLPPLTIALTASHVVAGAIASGDFEVVHHDRQAARQRGMPDIFLNILTTNGYVQRFVTAWAGPASRIRSVELRLGVPCFAGDTLELRGSVRSKQQQGAERLLEVEVRGANSSGEHVSATVRVVLP